MTQGQGGGIKQIMEEEKEEWKGGGKQESVGSRWRKNKEKKRMSLRK